MHSKYLNLDDGVKLNAGTINKAKANDGDVFQDIGFEYETKVKDYSKAMAWYQLGVNQNDVNAYNNIGTLYHNGFGVSQDYHLALDYYLKAARENQHFAQLHIGLLFHYGHGVPIDKYRALEWYVKSGENATTVKKLNKEGVHLRKEDKNKTIYQLANETEDILRAERTKRESALKEENQQLTQSKSLNEKEIQKLQNESQQKQQQIDLLEQEKRRNAEEREASTHFVNSLQQQLKYQAEALNSLKREIEASKKVAETLEILVQSKNNEIDMLKEKCSYIDRDNHELKRKLEESVSLVDNITNENHNHSTANASITHSGVNDSRGSHNNALDDNVNTTTTTTTTTRFKTEETEPTLYQNGNKKRKVASNGT